jgi:AcrR family transcriptional regulator
LGTRERRLREKDSRRREILETARSLFWKKGFTATTMPDIARAVELAPGTLYLYFPGKDALYIELLLECYADFLARLRAAAAKSAEPRRQAEMLVDTFMSFARDCPQCFDVIFFVMQRDIGGPHQARVDKELARRLDAMESACKQAAAAVLARAVGRRSPEKMRLTVEAVWSMLAGVVFFWRKDPEREFAAVASEAKRIVLAALFP